MIGGLHESHEYAAAVLNGDGEAEFAISKERLSWTRILITNG